MMPLRISYEIICALTATIIVRATATSAFPNYNYNNGQLYDDDDIKKFIEDVYRSENQEVSRRDQGTWRDAGNLHRDPYPRRKDNDPLKSFDYPAPNSNQDSELDYDQVLNALQTLLDEDEKSPEPALAAKLEPDELGGWDDDLQSAFSQDGGMRQRLLLTSYLEDMLGNDDTKDNWFAGDSNEDRESEKDADVVKELEEYSARNHVLLPEDSVTSDGKKERDSQLKGEPGEDAEEDETAVATSKKDAAGTEKEDGAVETGEEEDKSAHVKDDVDELRSLLTEMIESSRQDGKSDEALADDGSKTVKSTKVTITVNVPGVSVSRDDTYLCTTVKIPEGKNSSEPIYIVEYIPHAKEAVAHHMLLYGCAKPGMENSKVWDCGGTMARKQTEQKYKQAPLCSGGQRTILWAWAKDAPTFKLPNDVGFKVGSGTNIKYLVLQVHYKSASVFKGGKRDYSGVTVVGTKTKKPRLAGVYILASSMGTVPALSNQNFDIACQYKQPFAMHPFAFRTHTHALGVEVLGFRIRDGEWTLIGAKSPQLPEAFYPVATANMTIRYDDWLAARCRMRNFRSIPTSIGYRHTDEMCNFYVMFWVDSKYEKGLESWTKACASGFPWIHWRDLPGYYI